MRFYRHTAIVWFAIAATVLGSVPHFHCRCPNGNVKLFCLGVSCQSGCCCGPARQCCQPGSKNCQGATPGDVGDTAIGKGGCVKTIPDAPACSLTTSKVTAGSEDVALSGPSLVPFPAIALSGQMFLQERAVERNQFFPGPDLV